MIQTENHHWVPKFLLRNFASDDGRVYSFDLATGEIGKRPPKRLASSLNFNQLMVGDAPHVFEQTFERIETAAAPVIKKALNQNRLSDLSGQDRFALSRFVAAQSFRTQAYREGLGASRRGYDIGKVISAHCDDIDQLANLIAMRRWALMRTGEDRPFVIGDNPLVLQNTARPGDGGSLGLDMPGVEAMMPLSPCHALYMPSPDIGDLLIKGYWDALCIRSRMLAGFENHSDFTESEHATVERCLQKGVCLYRALRLGEPLQADGENVINLNALQVFWASSKVFSNLKDFNFVKQVLDRSPRAREIIPVHLVRCG
ncbi:DUF4238 domain-containing protein [Erythrobacter sp. SN021]|uniref:DUF4238 domain-containing protein n=1 Tax=Erythrobacter sp. SN021 TaxID=2912574 RepID=UPI001F2E2F81|nr:DUF4238 domain-containing protein [Erythrobacter sp. SN021]MCF8881493.1 DUF4238 domain-containing protein [Erythrobacter sp. SN021]